MGLERLSRMRIRSIPHSACVRALSPAAMTAPSVKGGRRFTSKTARFARAAAAWMVRRDTSERCASEPARPDDEGGRARVGGLAGEAGTDHRTLPDGARIRKSSLERRQVSRVHHCCASFAPPGPCHDRERAAGAP